MIVYKIYDLTSEKHFIMINMSLLLSLYLLKLYVSDVLYGTPCIYKYKVHLNPLVFSLLRRINAIFIKTTILEFCYYYFNRQSLNPNR